MAKSYTVFQMMIFSVCYLLYDKLVVIIFVHTTMMMTKDQNKIWPSPRFVEQPSLYIVACAFIISLFSREVQQTYLP